MGISAKKEKKSSFWHAILHPKGTVGEPWPTGEELINDPEVRKEFEKVKTAYENAKQKTIKNNS